MDKFEDLLGKTIVNIEGGIGDDNLVFTLDNDVKYRLFHYQDCCESVYIEDIVGDLGDLLNSPILLAEEVSNQNDELDSMPIPEHHHESFTWTFYKLVTFKGGATIRWFGTSTGYYSESVSFCKVN